jgi:hypothetical protein
MVTLRNDDVPRRITLFFPSLETENKPTELRTDPEIARDAVYELDSHIFMPSDKIKVTVKSGWVTLEGTVRCNFRGNWLSQRLKRLRE